MDVSYLGIIKKMDLSLILYKTGESLDLCLRGRGGKTSFAPHHVDHSSASTM